MFSLTAIRRGVAGAALGLACALPAFAADKPLDWTFGGVPPRTQGGEKIYFRIGETGGLQFVPREPGSPPNDHPVAVDPAVLKQQLLVLQLEDGKGKTEPLFGDDEAQDVAVELARALAVAKPGHDVLLFSSSRRGGMVLMPPVGLTARFFVANERLNVIVADPRVDYYGQWRINPSIRPQLVFGSRTAPSKTRLQAPAGALTRADWAALPLAAAPVAAAPAPARPGAVAAPAAAPAAVGAPAPAATVPAAQSGDPEQRLRTLKRLRDNGLITEDEFQQKKAEILKTL